jgi:hypothetical protein
VSTIAYEQFIMRLAVDVSIIVFVAYWIGFGIGWWARGGK